MSRLTNTNGKRIGLICYDLSDGETSTVIQISVTPDAGFFLKASPGDDDVEIQARENGSGDPFVDLSTSPIDLSGYTPGVPVTFDVRAVAAAELVDVRRLAIHIAATTSSKAGWAA